MTAPIATRPGSTFRNAAIVDATCAWKPKSKPCVSVVSNFIKTDTTFEYEDVKEWVKYGFTPGQAAAWMTESATESIDTELTPKTIRALVDRGITPEDIADMNVNEKTDAVDVIDYLRSRGIEKNRKRRTSRETR